MKHVRRTSLSNPGECSPRSVHSDHPTSADQDLIVIVINGGSMSQDCDPVSSSKS